MKLLIRLSLSIFITGTMAGCMGKREQGSNAYTQCEVIVSREMQRSERINIDREIFRRVSRNLRTGREIIWRDAYFKGRLVSSVKVLCIDEISGGLSFRVIDRLKR